jgi:hypothetical protein
MNEIDRLYTKRIAIEDKLQDAEKSGSLRVVETLKGRLKSIDEQITVLLAAEADQFGEF